MRWIVTLHIPDEVPMRSLRGLAATMEAMRLGKVEGVEPDVRESGEIMPGQALTIRLESTASQAEIKAHLKLSEISLVEVEEDLPETQATIPTLSTLVEEVSGLLVLADFSDRSALQSLMARFRGIAERAGQSNFSEVLPLAQSAVAILAEIESGTSLNPEQAWERLGHAVSDLQSEVRNLSSESQTRRSRKPKSPAAFPPAAKESPNRDQRILEDFLGRQTEILAEMEGQMLKLETDEGPTSSDALLRIFHSLKGDTSLLDLQEAATLCHEVENTLKGGNCRTSVESLLAAKDWLQTYFQHITGNGPHPGAQPNLSGETEPAEESPLVSASSSQPASSKALVENPELVACFVEESLEHLDNSEIHLLTVETNPENQEAMNAVFRAFHTIKGSAGMLCLTQVSELAHEAENLLVLAREGKLLLAGEVIDVVFSTVDLLKELVRDIRDNGDTEVQSGTADRIHDLIDRIKRAPSARPPVPAVPTTQSEQAANPKRLGEYLVESGLLTESDLAEMLRLQAAAPPSKPIGEILREMNILTKAQIEEALVQQKITPDRKIGEILVEAGDPDPEELEEALEQKDLPPPWPKLGEILVRSGQVEAKEVAQTLRRQAAQGDQPTLQIRDSVKVDAERLDQLIDTIGELVIAESMVSQSAELKSLASPILLRHLGQLDKITRELQEMGTSLRMVPVRGTFQKMTRLVRDLTRKSGKKVNLVMSGEDTELDKTVVDQIGDPLIHMIRNSMDHGIESDFRDRIRAGKPEAGRIDLRAYHKGGSIYIEVQDDGRGLDREAILAKGIERGLIRDGEALSDREIYNLIFQPGFSTAKKVSDVSGRGVGMDVVKRNVEALRGQVDISSEPGMGTIFTIRLPLTLAIIDGMVVRVSDERYIIPTLSIIQSLRPSQSEITTVVQRGTMLTVQGNLIPLFRLNRLFNITGSVEDPTRSTVVVVEDDGKQTGIQVDELLGQQQIVIKPLGEVFQGTPGLSGGAIMPDGRVGLILDVGSLIRLATTNGSHNEAPRAASEGVADASSPNRLTAIQGMN